MANKPLKNKKIGIASESSRFINDNESCGFWYEDVESAVKGLIEEIEEEKGLIKICDVCKHPNKIDNVIIVDTLREKIKKWFPDVVKDE